MKKYSTFLALAGFIVMYGAAEPANQGISVPDKMRVYLRLDKKVFYADEAVDLQVCVKNVSDRNNYFIVYDSSDAESADFTTFQPVVFEMNGRAMVPDDTLVKRDRDPADVVRGLDRRMVELAPGEIFIHAVNLKRLFDLKTDSPYRVQGLFYPVFEESRIIKSDNELVFKIIEEKRYNRESGVGAVDRSLAPSEVIVLTLKAEKDREWSRWEKFINVEKYIGAFPEFVQKYQRASYDDKPGIEREFISYMTRERDDYLVDFKVVKEEMETNRNTAHVDAIVDRFGIRWTYRYKCRFTLEKFDNLWLITDQEAMVMKGVKR